MYKYVAHPAGSAPVEEFPSRKLGKVYSLSSFCELIKAETEYVGSRLKNQNEDVGAGEVETDLV